MRPLLVVSSEEVRETPYRLPDVGVVLEVGLFILDSPPESFDKDIIEDPSFAVHTDGNVSILENIGKDFARKLRSLVGIENVRGTDSKGLFQGLHAEGSVEGKRYLPGNDIAAVPVHDGGQVKKALFHGDVGDIRAEDLVGPDNIEARQEIGIDRMLFVGQAQFLFRDDTANTHESHQTGYPFPVDPVALSSQVLCHPGNTGRGVLGIEPVDERHKVEIDIRDWIRPVIKARAIEA